MEAVPISKIFPSPSSSIRQSRQPERQDREQHQDQKGKEIHGDKPSDTPEYLGQRYKVPQSTFDHINVQANWRSYQPDLQKLDQDDPKPNRVQSGTAYQR